MKRRPRISYTEAQRALTWDRWQKGESIHDIARLFDRSHPAIQRILTLNGGYASCRATSAEHAAWQRALRPKACKLAGRPQLDKAITDKLQQQWSPEQRAGWLKRRYPDD
jgi:IS30 family transposase